MYPLLTRLSKAPASLGVQFRTTLLAVGHVAAGDAASAVSAFQHIDDSFKNKAYELAILQAAPLIGIPRTLHSAASLQAAGIVGNGSESPSLIAQQTNDISREQMQKDGTSTFEMVYGRNASRVRERLKNFHPGLDDWIVTCVYGALLSQKTGEKMVSLRERELCAVAALCVDPLAGVQLASHLRGAVLVGASAVEVKAVVGQTELVAGKRAAEAAEAVWATYERARYAL